MCLGISLRDLDAEKPMPRGDVQHGDRTGSVSSHRIGERREGRCHQGAHRLRKLDPDGIVRLDRPLAGQNGMTGSHDLCEMRPRLEHRRVAEELDNRRHRGRRSRIEEDLARRRVSVCAVFLRDEPNRGQVVAQNPDAALGHSAALGQHRGRRWRFPQRAEDVDLDRGAKRRCPLIGDKRVEHSRWVRVRHYFCSQGQRSQGLRVSESKSLRVDQIVKCRSSHHSARSTRASAASTANVVRRSDDIATQRAAVRSRSRPSDAEAARRRSVSQAWSRSSSCCDSLSARSVSSGAGPPCVRRTSTK